MWVDISKLEYHIIGDRQVGETIGLMRESKPTDQSRGHILKRYSSPFGSILSLSGLFGSTIIIQGTQNMYVCQALSPGIAGISQGYVLGDHGTSYDYKDYWFYDGLCDAFYGYWCSGKTVPAKPKAAATAVLHTCTGL